MQTRFVLVRGFACLWLMALSGQAMAACTRPDGVQGEIIYNKDQNLPQYCDGEDWVGLGWRGGPSGGGGGVPEGAVMSFDLADCPSGWSAYLPAQGRFVRGVDPEGTTDPDGVRVAGNVQEQDILRHDHKLRVAYGATGQAGTTYLKSWHYTSSFAQNFYTGADSASYGSESQMIDGDGVGIEGLETRPVNVALLYCRKD